MIWANKLRKLLLLSLFYAATIPLLAYTDGEYITLNNIQYRVVSGTEFTLEVVGGTGDSNGLLDIPAKVSDGRDVTFTVIAVDGLYPATYSNVTSVKLPETITSIGSHAFNGASLTQLTIPKSVTSISNTAFWPATTYPKFTVEDGSESFASDADGALYSLDMKTLYMVPSTVSGTYYVREGVESTCYIPFHGAEHLKKVVWPASIKSIPTTVNALDRFCDSLTTFEVAAGNEYYQTIDGMLCTKPTSSNPDVSLVKVPYGKHLTGTLKIPDVIKNMQVFCLSVDKMDLDKLDLNNVKSLNTATFGGSIGEYHIGAAFKSYGSQLSFGTQVGKFTVDGSNQYFASDDHGALFNKDKTTLLNYCTASKATSYDIPNSVTNIESMSFCGASSLKSVTIPYTVRTIGSSAFRSCNISSVTFEDTDEHPSQVTSLEPYVFFECGNLESIKIPRSVKTITSTSLSYCNSLKTITVADGSQLEKLEGGCLEGTDNLESFIFEGSCQLKIIGNGVFQNKKKLSTFTIPPSVTTIEANAFQGCDALKVLSFLYGSKITTIQQGAFSDCDIESMEIPESVIHIEREAFRNCASLKTITLSKNTTDVSPEAFKFCNNLTDILVNSENPVYSSAGGMLMNKKQNTLLICPPGKAYEQSYPVKIPPSTTAIGDYAFYDSSELYRVVIPKKLCKIGKRAFGLCHKLSQLIWLPDKVIDPENIAQGENDRAFDGYYLVNHGEKYKPRLCALDSSMQVQFKDIDFYKNNFDLTYPYFTSDDALKYASSYVKMKIGDQEINMPVTLEFYIENPWEWLWRLTLARVIPSENTNPAPYNNFIGTKTLVIPSSVKFYSGDYDQYIYYIDDYAFEGVDVDEVVIKGYKSYIGAMAFAYSTRLTEDENGDLNVEPVDYKIKDVVFTAYLNYNTRNGAVYWTLPEEFNAYDSKGGTQKIYVLKSSCRTITDKDVWGDYASGVDYKIPGISLKNKYGTFAREFDVDLNDYFTENSNGHVAAFTSADSITFIPGKGDYGEGKYQIHMNSIDVSGNEGTYIPANTGVLLKVMDDGTAATPEDFYYCIGEEDGYHDDQEEGLMHGVTVRPQTITGDNIYVMQGGLFRYVNTGSVEMPVHKAYLQADGIPAGAKIAFSFDDDSTATDVMGPNGEIMFPEEEDNAPIYNLSGQRVSNPTRGVYIRKGKKIVIK